MSKFTSSLSRGDEDNYIKIGDHISFKFGLSKSHGHLGADEILGSRVFVVDDSFARFQDCIFRVCPMKQYSAYTAFQKLSKKLENKKAALPPTTIEEVIKQENAEKQKPVDEQDKQDEHDLPELKAKAEQEEKQNELEMERMQGQVVVTYGMGIQLQHVKTSKYLTRTLESSAAQQENMRLVLDDVGSKKSFFVITPVHKMRSPGEPVRLGDQIQLVSLRNAGEFLHVSDLLSSDNLFEANISLTPSRFTIESFASHLDVSAADNIKAGDVVIFFHKEHEGFLSIPDQDAFLQSRHQELNVESSMAHYTCKITKAEANFNTRQLLIYFEVQGDTTMGDLGYPTGNELHDNEGNCVPLLTVLWTNKDPSELLSGALVYELGCLRKNHTYNFEYGRLEAAVNEVERKVRDRLKKFLNKRIALQSVSTGKYLGIDENGRLSFVGDDATQRFEFTRAEGGSTFCLQTIQDKKYLSIKTREQHQPQSVEQSGEEIENNEGGDGGENAQDNGVGLEIVQPSVPLVDQSQGPLKDIVILSEDQELPGDSEVFTLWQQEADGVEVFSIVTRAEQYLCIRPDGTFGADSTEITSSEKFKIVLDVNASKFDSKLVSLRSTTHNTLLCVKNETLECTSTIIGESEQFEFISVNGGTHCQLRAPNGKILNPQCVSGSSKISFEANCEMGDSQTTFLLVRLEESGEEDAYALQCCSGSFLCAEPNGVCTAERGTVGPWETFVISELSDAAKFHNQPVAVCSRAHQKYLRLNRAAGSDKVTIDGAEVSSDMERFKFTVKEGGTKCNIQAHNGKYLSVQNEDFTLLANGEDPNSPNATFAISKQKVGGDVFAIQAFNERFLCAEPFGRIVADREELGPWGMFQLSIESSPTSQFHDQQISMSTLSHNLFVGVNEDSSKVMASRLACTPSERFHFVPTQTDDSKCHLRTENGSYLSVDNHSFAMTLKNAADPQELGDSETFCLEQLEEEMGNRKNVFAVKTSQGKYLSADPPSLHICGKSDRFIQTSRALSSVPKTFEAWIRLPKNLDESIPGGVIIGSKPDPKYFSFEVHNAGMPKLLWNSGQVEVKIPGNDLRTDEWKHIAFVREKEQNGSGNTLIHFYCDGILVKSVQTNSNFDMDVVSTDSICVGNEKDAKRANAFQGCIRRVRLWHKSLSAEEISQAHKEEITNNTSIQPNDDVLHYEFSDLEILTDNVVRDLSPFENNGDVLILGSGAPAATATTPSVQPAAATSSAGGTTEGTTTSTTATQPSPKSGAATASTSAVAAIVDPTDDLPIIRSDRPLMCNKDSIGSNEKFVFSTDVTSVATKFHYRTVSIRTLQRGKYATTEEEEIYANRDSAGAFEQFELIPVNGGTHVQIRSHFGKFLSAKKISNAVACDVLEPGEGETFELELLENHGPNTYAFKTVAGYYLCSDPNGYFYVQGDSQNAVQTELEDASAGGGAEGSAHSSQQQQQQAQNEDQPALPPSPAGASNQTQQQTTSETIQTQQPPAATTSTQQKGMSSQLPSDTSGSLVEGQKNENEQAGGAIVEIGEVKLEQSAEQQEQPEPEEEKGVSKWAKFVIELESAPPSYSRETLFTVNNDLIRALNLSRLPSLTLDVDSADGAESESGRSRLISSKSEAEPLFKHTVFVHQLPSVKTTGAAAAAMSDMNSTNMWLIEKELSTRGGVISFNQPMRIKHLATGKYLCIDMEEADHTALSDHELGTSNKLDETTLFSFSSVLAPSKSGNVTYDSLIRIHHTHDESGWLRVLNNQHNGIEELRPVTLGSFGLEDVFSIYRVPPEDVKSLYFSLGVIPVLNKFLADCQQCQPAPPATPDLSKLAILAEPFNNALSQLILFLTKDTDVQDPMKREGIPVPTRQNFMRECGVLDVLLKILHAQHPTYLSIIRSDKSCRHIKLALRLCYRAIKQACKDNPSNAKFVSRDLEFLQKQSGYELKNADALMEIFRSASLELLESVPMNVLEGFFQHLIAHRTPRYLTILATACSCEGEPVLMMQKRIGYFVFENENFKDDILLPINEPGVRDVQRDITVTYPKKAPQPIHVFSNLIKTDRDEPAERSGKSGKAEEVKYLEEQIFLLSQLCMGRNTEYTKKIRKMFPLTMLISLILHPRIHPDLRSRFCTLMVHLYVDNHPNVPKNFIPYVQDAENIEYGDSWSYRSGRQSSRPNETSDEIYLKNFAFRIATLLDRTSQASDANHNFALALLDLVHKMFVFGYLSDDARKKVKEAVLKLLNSQEENKQTNIADEKNLAVMQCKMKALEILNLVLDQFIGKKTETCFWALGQHIQNAKHTKAIQKIESSNASVFSRAWDYMRMKRQAAVVDVETDDVLMARGIFASLTEGNQAWKDNFQNLTESLTGLVKYQYKPLAKEALRLLTRVCRLKQELFDVLDRNSILRNRQYALATLCISQMQKLRQNVSEDMSTTDFRNCLEILNDMHSVMMDDDNCKLYQRLLRRFGFLEIALKAHRVASTTGSLIVGFNRVLAQMVKGNKPNQEFLFPHFSHFVSRLSAECEEEHVLAAILAGNRSLCLQVDMNLVLSTLSKLQRKGNEYSPNVFLVVQALVDVACAPPARNQIVVLKSVMEKLPLASSEFFTPQWLKKLPTLNMRDDYESEKFSYFFEIVNLYANCSTGKNHTTESMGQHAFPFDSLVQIISIKRTSFEYINLVASAIRLLDEAYICTERPAKLDYQRLEDVVQSTLVHLVKFYSIIDHLYSEYSYVKSRTAENWARIYIDLEHPPDSLDIDFAPFAYTSEAQLVKCYENLIFDSILPFLDHFLSKKFSRQKSSIIVELEAASEQLTKLLETISNLDTESKSTHKRIIENTKRRFLSQGLKHAAADQTEGPISVIIKPTHVESELHRLYWDDYEEETNSDENTNENENENFKIAGYSDFIQKLQDLPESKLDLKLGELISKKQLTKPLISLCGASGHVTTTLQDQELSAQGADVLTQVVKSASADTSLDKFELNDFPAQNEANEESGQDQHNGEGEGRTQQEGQSDDLLGAGAVDPKSSEKAKGILRLKKTQKQLDQEGATSMALRFIACGSDLLVQRGLELAIALLEFPGGNKPVQRSFLHQLQKSSVGVLSFIESQITRAENEIKERKGIAKKNKDEFDQIQLMEENSEKTKELEKWKKKQFEFVETFKKSNSMSNILRFLQLLCEGHYRDMQEFLLQQEDAPKSINIVQRVLDYVVTLSKVIDPGTVTIASQAFSTLTELIQGPCYKNQNQIGVSSLFATSNHLLFRSYSEEEFGNLSPVLDLKNKVLLTLISLLEGIRNPEYPKHIPRTMLRMLNIEGMFGIVDNPNVFDSFVKPLETCVALAPYESAKNMNDHFTQKRRSEVQKLGAVGALAKTHEEFKKLLEEHKELNSEVRTNTFILLSALAEEDNNNERLVPDPQHNHHAKTTKVSKSKKKKTPPMETKELQHRRNIPLKDAVKWKTNHVYEWKSIKVEIGRVEVDRMGTLERVYFRIPELCQYLSKKTKEDFPITVDQDEANKIQDFVDKSELIVLRMRHQYRLHQNPFIYFLLTISPALFWMCNILSIVINFIVMTKLVKPGADFDDEGNETPITNRDGIYSMWVDDQAGHTVTGLGIGLLFFLAMHTLTYFLRDGIVSIETQKRELLKVRSDQHAKYQDGTFWLAVWDSDFGTFMTTVFAYISEPFMLFQVAAIIFAGLGLGIDPTFFAFQMFAIFIGSRHASNVIQAVTKNGVSLLFTTLLGVITMWAFSLVAFIFFNDEFVMDNVGPMCQSAGACFINIVNFGIRGGGMWEGANFPYDGRPWRIVWNMGFVITINIIFLNMIFGIIIDTFGELREEKAALQLAIESRCFICSIEKAAFDRKAEGLEAHQQNDHNLWNYIYFSVYLCHWKDPSEFTGTEQFVHNMIKRNDMSFYPQRKAMVLSEQDDDDDLPGPTTQEKMETSSVMTKAN